MFVQTPVPADSHVISTAVALCGSSACQHNLQASDFPLNPWKAFSTVCCNTLKYLGVSGSSDTTWTKLPVDIGLDVEDQSTGLQDHLTSTLWTFSGGTPKRPRCWKPIDDLVVVQQPAEKACQEIRMKPGIFAILRFFRKMKKACELCWHALEQHRETAVEMKRASAGTGVWTDVNGHILLS